MSDLPFLSLWPWVAAVAAVAVAAVGVAHVLLNKRDVRAAIGWAGLIVLSPFFGALAYYLLGINRIRRRAVREIEKAEHAELEAGSSDSSSGEALIVPESGPEPSAASAALGPHWRTLDRMVGRSTGASLVAGNQVTPLVNGDEAYPRMLEAIRSAERCVFLVTYIFETEGVGERFTRALAEATGRGVEVRVLVDGVGRRYSRPPVTRVLRELGVEVAEFLPPRLPLLRNSYFNLRNHRKCLWVDGEVAFTGGMNIRQGHVLAEPSAEPTRDVHFEVRGPVLEPLFEVMAYDWRFATGESLGGATWQTVARPSGQVPARVIADGPDEDFETMRWTLLAALATARKSVRIVTPYFLPERPLLTVLRLAALRGLEVDILLPEKNNLRFVQWASTAQLWQLLEVGCRIWRVPPPFDHSKLLVVDGAWSLVGSANWDPRSLRLNFELDLECYGEELAGQLLRLTDQKMSEARELTLADLRARSLPVRLRDAAARLLAPYL